MLSKVTSTSCIVNDPQLDITLIRTFGDVNDCSYGDMSIDSFPLHVNLSALPTIMTTTTVIVYVVGCL